jgi:hypothetical protein
MCRKMWRCSESFVSRVSGSGLHSRCSLAQSSNLSTDFHPISMPCLMCMSTSYVLTRQLYFSRASELPIG